jgi:hypothetical protein
MLEALRRGLIGVTLLVTPVVAIAQQAPDPLFGTRTLNVAKFTLPEAWTLRSVVPTSEAAGDALKATWTGTRADGTVSTIRFAAKFDGHDHPAVGSSSWDSIALQLLERLSIEAVRKKAGAIVGTLHLAVSEDGAVLTVTERDVSGARIAVLVYERQQLITARDRRSPQDAG